ncbi:MAG: VanZ family protein [Clostridia bacterium]|nr:VanZ family protein [Clostridia bacterium]
MYYLINFTLLGLIYFLVFYKKWSKKTKTVLIINTLMYVYISIVLYVTLMPFTFPLGGSNNLFMRSANFIPFKDLRLNRAGSVKEIILNVVMMVPFGFLYPITKTKGIIKTVIITFIFSLAIECSQLLSVWWGGFASRTFDVTDLITNTTGGFIGYLIFIILKPFVSIVLKENN